MFGVREINIAIELWGVAFCAFGIVCAVLFSQTSKYYRALIIGGFALELIAAGGDALAGMFRGAPGTTAWIATHVGNCSTFLCNLLLVPILTNYFCERLKEAGSPPYHSWRRAVGILSLIMCALVLMGAFYYIDEANLYHRSNWYWVSLAFAVVTSVGGCLLVIRNRRSLKMTSFVALMFYALGGLVASLAQMLVYGLNFAIIYGVICMVAIFFETRAISARLLAERTEELTRAQLEVSESRISVMVSQIQPHFLFNTLDTIYGLCDEDTEQAKKAIASFSRYLRTNLASLRGTTPVPIETEMEHVRTYLELERMSDESKLSYDIDMDAVGFFVPALSVQTIVENAVKHGVGKREQGGIITIRTSELADEFTVTITDNGVGFDPAAVPDDGTHLGLVNTRQRLSAMCGGWLEIISKPGIGTTVVMHFPNDQQMMSEEASQR